MRAERDARVVSLQHHHIARLVEPEAEAVALLLLRYVAARPHHLRHPSLRHDLPGEQGDPERAQIGCGGVDPAVTAADHREVEHVRPRAVVGEIAQRGVAREFVGTQEFRVRHRRRAADALSHELVELHAARPLGDQREDDESAVAVGEALPRRRHGGMAAEHREVLLRRRELVDGNRHHVVGDVGVRVLVEVVADARPVGEEMFDRDAVVDQREVVTEHRSSRGRQLERSLVDQAHHRERRQALHAARDREPRVDGVRDRVRAIGRPYAFASSTPSGPSTRTTPENPVSWAIASTASWSVCIG